MIKSYQQHKRKNTMQKFTDALMITIALISTFLAILTALFWLFFA